MATWTQSTLQTETLRRLGLLGAGQSEDSDDTKLLKQITTSVYDQLVKEGLVLTLISAIPEWAQQPLTKIMAAEAASYFGFTGQRLQLLIAEGRAGRRDLARQVSAEKRITPIRTKYY